ncbi:MAG: CsbD family protein [Marmoricola sp.]
MGVEDKASNSFKDAKGKVKETTGKATDNEQLEGEGKADQVEASVKESVEHLKDAAGNVRDAFKK